MMPKPHYFPLFAELRGRACVVAGGGRIAQGKVAGLLACGAAVTVVSPTLTPRLRRQAGQGKIRHVRRRFRPADLKGAWLAFAATDEQPVNEAVFRAALRYRVFANVVDQKPLCTFIVPAIARTGALTVAVSSGGLSPTIAKQVRDDVAARLGRAYDPLARLLGSLRRTAQRRLPTYQERQRYFERVAREPRILASIRQGRRLQARRAALALLAETAARP